MKKTTKIHRGGRGGAGSRELHIHLKKKAGTIKASSRRWLERQLNDPYVHRAKLDGYRSRAAYKLLEINDRYPFLKKGQKLIDLGAAPGGWSQVAASLIGSDCLKPSLVAIDYLPLEPLPAVHCLQMDFLTPGISETLLELLGDRPDIVLSDMAAPTIGHRKTDHFRTVHLSEEAAYFAVSVLKEGGSFLTKTFQGGTENHILTLLKQKFKFIHHIKPPSSRPESVELYLLARFFKG